MRRQVLATDKISGEKEREQSKITPRLRTVSDKGKGRRGGWALGGWKAINSVFDWLRRRRRDEVQEEMSAKISERNEDDARGIKEEQLFVLLTLVCKWPEKVQNPTNIPNYTTCVLSKKIPSRITRYLFCGYSYILVFLCIRRYRDQICFL